MLPYLEEADELAAQYGVVVLPAAHCRLVSARSDVMLAVDVSECSLGPARNYRYPSSIAKCVLVVQSVVFVSQ